MSKYVVVASQINHITHPAHEFVKFGEELELTDEDAHALIVGNTGLLPKADFDAINPPAQDRRPGMWGAIAPASVRACWDRLHVLREELITAHRARLASAPKEEN